MSAPTSTRASSPSSCTRSGWAPTGHSSSTRTPTHSIARGPPSASGSTPLHRSRRSRSRSTRVRHAAPCARQIARLERELASLFVAARPGDDLDWHVGNPGGPRVLDIGDLEALRDDLATRVEEIRHAQRERAEGYSRKARDARGDGRRSRRPQVAARLQRGHRGGRLQALSLDAEARPRRNADGLVARQDLVRVPIAVFGMGES